MADIPPDLPGRIIQALSGYPEGLSPGEILGALLPSRIPGRVLARALAVLYADEEITQNDRKAWIIRPAQAA